MGKQGYTYAAASDVGRVRNNNEDALLVSGRIVRDDSAAGTCDSSAGNAVFAVADGLGGCPAGEVASEKVLQTLEQLLGGVSDGEGIADACRLANTDLIARAAERADYRGMATTCTGLVAVGTGLLWFNAGDSRLYRATSRDLVQVSSDHTLREEMSDPSIPGNIVTNCFGNDEFRVDVGEIDAEGDSVFLLCSDGLSDYANMDRVASDMCAAAGSSVSVSELTELAARLVSAALDGGGGDNISVLIVAADE